MKRIVVFDYYTIFPCSVAIRQCEFAGQSPNAGISTPPGARG
ncbi:hypothetical protein FEDK69T_31270 [Flavobacterium enshiense DK69]|nr:hypothetical protein [Flavobacterium enshiense]ESU19790.1 hypothetical protein FEDK69T_31270 [Flavobacterium enshiense DK69]